MLDVIEAAYDTQVSPSEWLERASREFGKRVKGAVCPFAYTLKTTGAGRPEFPAAFFDGVSNAVPMFEELHDAMDATLAGVFFPQGTSSSSYRTHMRALSNDAEYDVSAPEEMLSQLGCDDFLGVASIDASGRGVLLGAATSGSVFTERDKELHRRVAIHMAAGSRVRQSLAANAEKLELAEAVFEADGRLSDARGAAVDMRGLLSEAVGRIDRARTRAERADEMQATELWQGLVEGRWSILEHHDTDSRRYYVAIPNMPLAAEDRALTPIERRVAAMVIVGESNKVIGYSLGMSESTAGSHLRHVLRKLGLETRLDLIKLGMALEGGS